jgi:hypothetical protein
VSQIYNIPGDLSVYLFTWALLCVPLIYLLKSNALALLHLVYITSYACAQGYFVSYTTPWLYLLVLGLYLPYYLKLEKNKNITSILNWLTPLSLVIVLGTFISHEDEIGFLMYVVLFGMLYNIGRMPFYTSQKLRRNGYLIIGSLGTVCLLLTASFNWFWHGFLSHGFSFESQEFVITLILFIVASGLSVYTVIKKGIAKVNFFQVAFIGFTILFFLGLTHGSITLILTNLLVLILGVMTIKAGVDKYHLGVLNYGLLIVTALITCRFFDTNISFVLRGLLFVIIGAGFFVTNYAMLKKRKNIEISKIKDYEN